MIYRSSLIKFSNYGNNQVLKQEEEDMEELALITLLNSSKDLWHTNNSKNKHAEISSSSELFILNSWLMARYNKTEWNSDWSCDYSFNSCKYLLVLERIIRSQVIERTNARWKCLKLFLSIHLKHSWKNSNILRITTVSSTKSKPEDCSRSVIKERV